MYDRAPRFRKITTATPENVGPATYYLSDIFDKNTICQCGPGGQAPFNSSSLRTISFTNKTLTENPSPNKYKICFRKQRIVSGTTIRNKGPRFTYRDKDYIIGPDLTKEANRMPGHNLVHWAIPHDNPSKCYTISMKFGVKISFHEFVNQYDRVMRTAFNGIKRGLPPRNSVTKVSTIPERGAEGYLVTDDGLKKIYNPPENRPVGPTTYYNPEGHENYTTLQYKGNFWSLRTAKRFKHKTSDGPSPADYTINEKHESPWEKYQDQLRSTNKANAPSLRYDDVLLQKLCREDLPGPGAYSAQDPNFKKCECGVGGTFSKSKRGSLYNISEGPGPAAYKDPRTALEKASRTLSVAQHPFNVTAQRFSDRHQGLLPGPAEYNPKFGLWNEVKKRGHSRYSQFSAPFDSSSYRNTVMTKSDVLCIPGPDMYYPKFQRKGDKKQSYMFASKMKRDFSNFNQNLPAPNTYPTTEPFKLLNSHKSHLQPKDSAFLTSSVRMKPLGESCSPGPDTYDTIQSSLNSKSGVIGLKFPPKAVEKTPGPADYKINPKYGTLGVLHTNNATLRQQLKPKGNKMQKAVSKKKKINEVVKKLRCFSSSPDATRHCPID